jgi:hypothetical protein
MKSEGRKQKAEVKAQPISAFCFLPSDFISAFSLLPSDFP